jgi:hypothetical protein
MSYSLTLNLSSPSSNTLISGYRVKYWPTNTPTAVSTVNTQGFPLVITDLNNTSYSGTVETKCGTTYVTYSSPKSFGPVAVVSSGGGGSSPACPYKIVLFSDDELTVPISSNNNQTGCIRYAYRVRLVTAGNAAVTVTGSEVSIPITYVVQTGDCASPTGSQTLTASLTIPAGMSESSNYLQTPSGISAISSINFGSGAPTTVMGCATTYVNSSGQTATGGGAYFTNTGTCNNGHGTYVLNGTVGDQVVLTINASAYVSPNNSYAYNSTPAWVALILNTSTNGTVGTPRYRYSECVLQGSSYISLSLDRVVVIPAGGSIEIQTDVIKYNSSSGDAVTAQLQITSVNGGANTNATNTIGQQLCHQNSTGQSICPGSGQSSGQY